MMDRFKKYKLISLLAFLIMSCGIMAQKFTANASKTKVVAGEQFQIAYSLNTGGSNFKTPNLNGFDVYSGPNQSSSMQFINGTMSQSISFSFILAARKEGKFTIPPASIIVNGSRIESNELVIEVAKGGTPSAQQPSQGNPGNPNTPQNGGDNLFAITTVNKTKAYLGEQITVVHKIYTKLNLRGFQDIQFPSYDGFWSQDMPQKGQIALGTENVNGVAYYVAEIKKSFIFAQKTGTIEISPVEIECVVRERTSNAPQSIFDLFSGNGGYQDAIYKTKSKPIKIEIQPLPEQGKPENFNGAVGNFSFKALVNKEKIKANDAINLNIAISGQGNLKLLNTPVVGFPEGFETYDPKVSENISINTNGVSGSKTFDYLVIPRNEGDYNITNVGFSYFDPAKKTYITLPSPEFNIHVEKSDKPAEQIKTTASGIAKEDVKIIGNDIRYIKTGPTVFIEKDEHFFGSSLFYTGIGAPVFLLAAFLLVRRKHISENSDLIAVKSRKANKVAQKRLMLAKTHVEANNKEAFYDEILRAMNGYFSDKFNLPASEFTKEAVVDRLKKRNVSEGLISDFTQTIDVCEAARYAPSMASNELVSVFEKAATVITQTENEIS